MKKKEKEKKKNCSRSCRPFGCIQDLLEEERHNQIKIIEISNGDTDLLKLYLEKMKKHFIDIIEELKSTRSS